MIMDNKYAKDYSNKYKIRSIYKVSGATTLPKLNQKQENDDFDYIQLWLTDLETGRAIPFKSEFRGNASHMDVYEPISILIRKEEKYESVFEPGDDVEISFKNKYTGEIKTISTEE